MGKDKFENEELIRHGFLEDIWYDKNSHFYDESLNLLKNRFHVDDLSSAHVYLRLPMGQSTLDDISDTLLEECAQLVKVETLEPYIIEF